MGEGADRASLAGSLPPLAGASAPVSPWVKKKKKFRGEMGEGADRASLAGSLPPLAGLSAPDSGSTLMEDFNSTQKNFFQGEKGEKGQAGHLWLAASHPWLEPLPLSPPG